MVGIKRNYFFLAQIVIAALIGGLVYSILCQLDVGLFSKILTIIPSYCMLLFFSAYALKKHKAHSFLKNTLWGIGAISVAYTAIAIACYFFSWGNALWYAFITSMVGVLILEALFFYRAREKSE